MPSPAQPPAPAVLPAVAWPAVTWLPLLVALALATLLVHGFHPFAEDGGLYAAGVEYTLDPSLFPHYTAFVTEHLRFSLFAPSLAAAIRVTHLSLRSALLLLDLVAALLTLLGARELLRRCVGDARAQLAGLALLAAGWTLPIAGTSLYLMDPYVTARSLAMPFSLFALAFALDPWLTPAFGLRHPALRCAACLLIAAVFHPLMAAYALLFVIALRSTRSASPRSASPRSASPRKAWSCLTLSLLLLCMLVNSRAPAETPAETAAVVTRYYWFLSQWHWYERLGLLGPLVMLGLVLRARTVPRQPALRTLAQTAIGLGLLCALCALLFADESFARHAVARLQPLRMFVLLYTVMLLLLGASLHSVCTQAARRASGLRRGGLRLLPALATLAMAAGLFAAERSTFPASPHIELPWRAGRTHNPWVQAFLWIRANTPRDALFALDARYVNTDGEDAQTFRAISLRSALPDYSKDGGEASITPTLAPAWLPAANAQKDLSELPDAERDRRLQPFGVTWVVLHAAAPSAHPCPYRNAAVKVCRLQP